MKPDCYPCKHKQINPGHAYISCTNPDPAMKGNPQAILKGWFLYPIVFDPVWMEKECCNFTPLKKNNNPTRARSQGE